MARMIGILLILAGVVALVYGGFYAGHEDHALSAAGSAAHGPLVDDQQMPVPPLTGAIALGAGLLFFVLSIPRPRRVGS
jgi:hypothetical protein